MAINLTSRSSPPPPPPPPPPFTQWWFEAGNPNDATTVAKGDLVPSTCNLQYFHKADVSPEDPTTFTECHPWQEASCCHEATVTTPVALNEGYGEGYEWDRCGKMSQACERFFVQEAWSVNPSIHPSTSDCFFYP